MQPECSRPTALNFRGWWCYSPQKGFFHNDEDVLGSGSVHFDRRFTFRDSEFKPFEISLSRVSDGAVVVRAAMAIHGQQGAQ